MFIISVSIQSNILLNLQGLYYHTFVLFVKKPLHKQ